MEAHKFQRDVCSTMALGPFLNVASKEDPAKLGESFGAINLDLLTYDEHTNKHLTELPNFVHGDALNMTMFEAGRFGTVVLGEFIEHCVPAAAEQALRECVRVMRDSGTLVLTFPLDGRPKEVQHAAHHLKVWLEGDTGSDITVWHQTVWEDDALSALFATVGLDVVLKKELRYAFVKNRKPAGWGIVLKKATSPATN